jgi:hypothetical protein
VKGSRQILQESSSKASSTPAPREEEEEDDDAAAAAAETIGVSENGEVREVKFAISEIDTVLVEWRR